MDGSEKKHQLINFFSYNYCRRWRGDMQPPSDRPTHEGAMMNNVLIPIAIVPHFLSCFQFYLNIFDTQLNQWVTIIWSQTSSRCCDSNRLSVHLRLWREGFWKDYGDLDQNLRSSLQFFCASYLLDREIGIIACKFQQFWIVCSKASYWEHSLVWMQEETCRQ